MTSRDTPNRHARPATPAARRRAGSEGQSLAEFALVFPVLMLIIGGIVQFGIIFWGLNTLNQVVRDTGRWAATQQACDTGVSRNSIIAKANAIAAQSSLIGYATGSWSSSNMDIAWSGTPCPPRSNADEAWVTITIRHRVPILLPFVPGNGSIGATTQYRMEPAPS